MTKSFDLSYQRPAVSVVIPTYNRWAELERALNSLAEQSYSDFEVIVVDDGSTDPTPSVVEEYSEILRLTYIYQENSGRPGVARNKGVSVSSAELIAFLDSDDWWEPTKLEESVQAMDRGADVVYHDLVCQSTRPRLVGYRRVHSLKLAEYSPDALLRRGNPIPLSSVVLRKDLLLQAGGFSELQAAKGTEDFDLWIRIAGIGARFCRHPKALGNYWLDGEKVSTASQILSRILYLQEYHLEPRGIRPPPWMLFGKGSALLLCGKPVEARPLLVRSIFTLRRHQLWLDRWISVYRLMLSFS